MCTAPGLAAAAEAAPYPPGPGCALAVDGAVTAGLPFDVVGSGLPPDELVLLRLDPQHLQLDWVRTDATGAFRVVVHAPAGLTTGSYLLSAQTDAQQCRVHTHSTGPSGGSSSSGRPGGTTSAPASQSSSATATRTPYYAEPPARSTPLSLSGTLVLLIGLVTAIVVIGLGLAFALTHRRH